MHRSTTLLFVLLLFFVPPEVWAAQSPQWTHGPPTDASFFPIAVWLQNPRNAAAYRKAGINIYFGLWEGPTEQQLEQLKAAKMLAVCEQNDIGLAHRDDPTIVGWMQQPDEPDNAQDGKGPNTFVPPQRMIDQYRKLREADPTRPVFINLGQGVANDDWIGHGSGFRPDLYPQYARAADVLMWDLYPVAGLGKKGGGHRDDGENLLYLIPKGIDRLHAWAPGKPVWDVIECTNISNTRTATPRQVKAEVWMALVHGSRGICYFVHRFKPRFDEHALLDDEPMLAAVTAINRQIHELAPVLNSADAADVATATTSDPRVPIDIAARRYQGDLYVFAVGMRNAATRGSFHVRGTGTQSTAQVIGEDRTVPVNAGEFHDDFEPYGMHLYRIRPGS